MQKFTITIPEREEILTTLMALKIPANLERLVETLQLTRPEQQEALHRRLRAMERDGQVVFTRKKCYALPEKLDLIKGTVIAHREGYGFLHIGAGKADLYIPHDQMQKVIHGDKVLAQQLPSPKKDRGEVRIVRILEEVNPVIVGRYLVEAGIAFVIADESHFNFDILIPQEYSHQAEHGSIVVVELLQRPQRRVKALGRVVEVLGKEMATDIAIDVAIRTYDLPYLWNDDIHEQLQLYFDHVTEEEKQNRVDLTALPLVTIDGEDAKDFDDAVYAQKTKTGWRLYVAIADVSHYVKTNSAIDLEAMRRGTSVYFPTQVLPMLPELLSNGLCSLNPAVDRLCMVCEMDISTSGELTKYQFYEAVMNSHARLTYTEVAAIFEKNQNVCERYSELLPHLFELHALYRALDSVRQTRGAIAFESEEPKFIFDKENRIKHIERQQRNDAHKLIEECMIMANVAAATFTESHKEPVLYRVHDIPSAENVTKVRTILNSLGLTLRGTAVPTPKDYAQLLEETKDRIDQEMITTILLRSLRQAKYQPDNQGHFGLALEAYAHFTSPIRRYPDLLLHRSIKALLADQRKTATKHGHHYTFADMLTYGEHCSTTERRAEEASRDVVDWLKCDFMSSRIGDVFAGTISSVTSFGFFVRLNDFLIDGLVHISSLENDYYIFQPENIELVGSASGITYGLGDKVTVSVDAVSLDERKIDFSLLSVEQKLRRKRSSKGKTTTEKAAKKMTETFSANGRKKKPKNKKKNK